MRSSITRLCRPARGNSTFNPGTIATGSGTCRDITIKYKQSVMGFLWAILMPLVIVGAGVLVRAGVASVSGRPLLLGDVAAVALKAVPWAFVVSGIRFASNSLVGNSNLLTKIYLPREIFPLASVGSQLIDFAVATVPL